MDLTKLRPMILIGLPEAHDEQTANHESGAASSLQRGEEAALMEKAMQHVVSSLWTPPFISFRHDVGVLQYTNSGISWNQMNGRRKNGESLLLCCSDYSPLPVVKKRKRYRKQYPGESTGITEEMRFVAMKLRNTRKTNITHKEEESEENGDNDDDGDETWQPSMEGFLKYLVDSKLIFDTVERIIDESHDVSYAYFRRTGLERSGGLSKDLEWFSQQKMVIPQSSNPGVSYAQYLEEIAEKSAPLFLCHFYNIYFSHMAGGQVIARRVSEKLLGGRELEFYKWEGDVQELLKGVREKLNMLGEHWSRDEKNKCLREATKSFRFMGQIVRLIIS